MVESALVANMPCWYFDRKQIKNSPSFLDGIDTNTENRYRREGARFIIDVGTKMGLRCDTYATGVVFFHRFYMFHSFKEFYRYVTAACCLFLAGKVEETPKKCKDIIKIAQSLLSHASYIKFGEDPREEVMTMERILLKTIKFDFLVEHPYSFLLKYAKNFKSEKEKIQNMAQVAWTFTNDSLCTTVCLQWEPEVVGISMMYLASRFTKFEPGDWTSKSSSRSKWWEDWVEGMSMELMEDICHQVLDLYSNKNKKCLEGDSPPSSPSKSIKAQSTPPPPPDRPPPPPKRTREEAKMESESNSKSSSADKEMKMKASRMETENNSNSGPGDSGSVTGKPIPIAKHRSPVYSKSSSYKSTTDSDGYSSYNPYVSSRMLSSSFMSQEGTQNIQSILTGTSTHLSVPYSDNPPPPPHHGPPERSQYPPAPHHGPPERSQYPPAPHHGPPDSSQYPPASHHGPPVPPTSHSSQYSYLPPPSQSQYAPPSIPPPHSYPPPGNAPSFDPYTPPPANNPSSYQQPSTFAPTPPVSISGPPQHSYLPPSMSQGHSYNFPPTHLPPPSHLPRPSNYPPPSHPYPHPGYGGVARNYPGSSAGNNRTDIPSLTEVKISGRPDWNMNN